MEYFVQKGSVLPKTANGFSPENFYNAVFPLKRKRYVKKRKRFAKSGKLSVEKQFLPQKSKEVLLQKRKGSLFQKQKRSVAKTRKAPLRKGA